MSTLASRAYLVAAPSTDGHPLPVVQLHDGALWLTVTDADEPFLLALELARLGYAVAAGFPVPEQPDDPPAPLVLVPAQALTCPPWCTTCASPAGPELRPDVPTGRAVLVHRRRVGHVGTWDAGWTVDVVAHVLLADPPEFGAAGVDIAPMRHPGPALAQPAAQRFANHVTAAAVIAATPYTRPDQAGPGSGDLGSGHPASGPDAEPGHPPEPDDDAPAGDPRPASPTPDPIPDAGNEEPTP